MDIITKKDIAGLDSLQNAFCISIYIPVHKKGEDVLHRKDALLLKNQLKEVKTKLEKEVLSKDEIDDLVAPIQALIDDSNFWRHQENGLAIFLTDGILKRFTLPILFEPFNQVANTFYLSPLLPMFTGDGSYFVLSLELEKVKLYKQTRYNSSEIFIDELIPSRMEERVGYDFEQKNLQFRSQHQTHGTATYHGHGEADRDRKDEISRYLWAIDRGLMTLIRDENKPMVIASQDYIYGLFKKVNTYHHLLDDYVSCNLSETDESTLHELAWNKVAPLFEEQRIEKFGLFKQYEDTGRTSSEIKQVLPAALMGKIDTLFIRNNSDIWGVYEPQNNHVRVDDNSLPTNVSLSNKAAIKTFLNGGKVYVMEKDNMPNPYSMINALYRY
ncbi:hypothetical protein ACOCEA_17640 [Maribacter sp. CXY002]|uniref:baeRF7 domain-containing protein n=1 Tax=Maribacter luteocoastalis TaxID=3407671 RepID=UPI003B68312D